RAPLRDVRLLDQAEIDVAGTRSLLDGVLALRRSTQEQGGRDHQQGEVRPRTRDGGGDRTGTCSLFLGELHTTRKRCNGQSKIRAEQAPRERRHDRARRPWQNDPYRRTDEGLG